MPSMISFSRPRTSVTTGARIHGAAQTSFTTYPDEAPPAPEGVVFDRAGNIDPTPAKVRQKTGAVRASGSIPFSRW